MKKAIILQRKAYISQLIDILENSDDYIQYIKKNDRYRKYIEDNGKLAVWSIKLFDTYDNRQFNVLGAC